MNSEISRFDKINPPGFPRNLMVMETSNPKSSVNIYDFKINTLPSYNPKHPSLEQLEEEIPESYFNIARELDLKPTRVAVEQLRLRKSACYMLNQYEAPMVRVDHLKPNLILEIFPNEGICKINKVENVDIAFADGDKIEQVQDNIVELDLENICDFNFIFKDKCKCVTLHLNINSKYSLLKDKTIELTIIREGVMNKKDDILRLIDQYKDDTAKLASINGILGYLLQVSAFYNPQEHIPELTYGISEDEVHRLLQERIERFPKSDRKKLNATKNWLNNQLEAENYPYVDAYLQTLQNKIIQLANEDRKFSSASESFMKILRSKLPNKS